MVKHLVAVMLVAAFVELHRQLRPNAVDLTPSTPLINSLIWVAML